MFVFFLVSIGIFAFVIASGIAALTRHLTGRGALSMALGTLAMPAILLALLTYWTVTMEADDAPPGMVILGSLAAIGVIAPVALLASYLTLKFLTRRALRNGS